MRKTIFINRQSRNMENIVEKSMHDGYTLEVFPSSPNDSEKIERVAKTEFQIFHPAR
jgi:hypothetical protein